jgi:hypothetical protein
MERPQTASSISMQADQVSFTIKPYEIKTVQVNYPLAQLGSADDGH